MKIDDDILTELSLIKEDIDTIVYFLDNIDAIPLHKDIRGFVETYDGLDVRIKDVMDKIKDKYGNVPVR